MNAVKQYQYQLNKHYQREQQQRTSQHRLANDVRQTEKYVNARPSALERLLSRFAKRQPQVTVERRQLRLRRRTT
ncbi:MAG: hypothetical protein CL607_12830 [Anaerolineaceae bacterium]|nr:hypothetical protein [Anaerolineaceae bacterium]